MRNLYKISIFLAIVSATMFATAFAIEKPTDSSSTTEIEKYKRNRLALILTGSFTCTSAVLLFVYALYKNRLYQAQRAQSYYQNLTHDMNDTGLLEQQKVQSKVDVHCDKYFKTKGPEVYDQYKSLKESVNAISDPQKRFEQQVIVNNFCDNLTRQEAGNKISTKNIRSLIDKHQKLDQTTNQTIANDMRVLPPPLPPRRNLQIAPVNEQRPPITAEQRRSLMSLAGRDDDEYPSIASVTRNSSVSDFGDSENSMSRRSSVDGSDDWS